MSSIIMPPIRQMVTPNYSPTLIEHGLIIIHRTEGAYEGACSWLCMKASQASAHLVMKMDGTAVTQLVPLMYKAWAECSFNGKGISLEVEGFTKDGMPDSVKKNVALVVAWLCKIYGIKPGWAKGGLGSGICQHHDLGAAGGGHVDCSGVGSAEWMSLLAVTQQVYNDMWSDSLPSWALHGLPSPSTAVLPTLAPPVASHGGAPRNSPGDIIIHDTFSNYPHGSIQDLQWRLKKVGANPALGIDGDEGIATRQAIATFEKAVGLPVTSDMNPTVWAKLDAAVKALTA